MEKQFIITVEDNTCPLENIEICGDDFCLDGQGLKIIKAERIPDKQEKEKQNAR